MECNDCGYIWESIQGDGFNASYYHCNKCGKDISIESGKDPKLCDCGGLFVSCNNVCPECKNHNITKGNDIALWD